MVDQQLRYSKADQRLAEMTNVSIDTRIGRARYFAVIGGCLRPPVPRGIRYRKTHFGLRNERQGMQGLTRSSNHGSKPWSFDRPLGQKPRSTARGTLQHPFRSTHRSNRRAGMTECHARLAAENGREGSGGGGQGKSEFLTNQNHDALTAHAMQEDRENA
jgi:hypothetical protein